MALRIERSGAAQESTSQSNSWFSRWPRGVQAGDTIGFVGALRNLGHNISDQTVGNFLERNGIPPAPRRKPAIPWAEFIKMHEDVLTACDFFTAEVFTPAGLVTYYVLFFFKESDGCR